MRPGIMQFFVLLGPCLLLAYGATKKASSRACKLELCKAGYSFFCLPVDKWANFSIAELLLVSLQPSLCWEWFYEMLIAQTDSLYHRLEYSNEIHRRK